MVTFLKRGGMLSEMRKQMRMKIIKKNLFCDEFVCNGKISGEKGYC